MMYYVLMESVFDPASPDVRGALWAAITIDLDPKAIAIIDALRRTAADHFDTAAFHRSINTNKLPGNTEARHTQTDLDARAKGTVAAMVAAIRALGTDMPDLDHSTVAAIARDLIDTDRGAQRP